MPNTIDSQIVKLIERQATHEESQRHLITSIDNLTASMDAVVRSNNELLVSQAELKTHVKGVVDKFDGEINSIKEDVDGIGVRLSDVEKNQQKFENYISEQEGGDKAVKKHRDKNTAVRTLVLSVISLAIAAIGMAFKIISDNGGV